MLARATANHGVPLSGGRGRTRQSAIGLRTTARPRARNGKHWGGMGRPGGTDASRSMEQGAAKKAHDKARMTQMRD